MNELIKLLQQKNLVWHAGEQKTNFDVSTSGYTELDNKLDGGFPRNGVIEINSPVGIGELRLILPYLKQQNHNRLTVFIHPPGHINAEHLDYLGFELAHILIITTNSQLDALWATEQCLKSGACSSVMLWHQALEVHHIKRFQIAAKAGDCLHVMFTTAQSYRFSLPVTLSLKLTPHNYGVNVTITKRKGGWPLPTFTLDMSSRWPALTLSKHSDNLISFPTTKVI